ncbi:MAG TPA: hypothetical protein DCF33_16365, partial [Saprospirales bacterium]|nr:hypothetical protein [Saprospirales bacterium]
LSNVTRVNLVQNTGIGAADATHTVEDDKKARLKASPMIFPLIHPKEVSRRGNMDTSLFYAAQKSRIRLVLWFILHKLRFR